MESSQRAARRGPPRSAIELPRGGEYKPYASGRVLVTRVVGAVDGDAVRKFAATLRAQAREARGQLVSITINDAGSLIPGPDAVLAMVTELPGMMAHVCSSHVLLATASPLRDAVISSTLTQVCASRNHPLLRLRPAGSVMEALREAARAHADLDVGRIAYELACQGLKVD